MADKRSASRQRRANENRAARESLAARRAAAAEKAEQAAQELEEIDHEIHEGEVVPEDEAPRPRPSLFGGSRNARTAGATRRGRPTGPSPVPEHGPGLGGYIEGLRQVPGGLQVLIGAVLALVLAVLIGGVIKFSPSVTERMGAAAAGRKAPPDESLTQTVGPVILVVLALPFLCYVIALVYALRPNRRKVWFASAIGALVTSAYALSPIGIFGLVIGGGLLGWGAYKTTKAERI